MNDYLDEKAPDNGGSNPQRPGAFFVPGGEKATKRDPRQLHGAADPRARRVVTSLEMPTIWAATPPRSVTPGLGSDAAPTPSNHAALSRN